MKATMNSDILGEEVIVQDSSKENVQDSGKANTNDNNIEKTSGDNQQMTKSQGQDMMVGAVTAALGASALVAHNQVSKLISQVHFLVYDFLWTCYSIVYIILLEKFYYAWKL